MNISRSPLVALPIHRWMAATLVAAALLAPQAAAARPRADANRQPAPGAIMAQNPYVIVVSLRKQRLSVYNRDGHVTDSPISSGTSEFPTPTGVFSVIGKEVEHESNIYEGAAMPYMQRLTWTGTAMHAGNLPGYPASHGCIRLPYNFSQRLFEMTSINTRVIVTRDDVAPQSIAHARLPTLPAAVAPNDVPMSSTTGSRIASLAGVGTAIAAPAPAPVLLPGQLPLSLKAKTRMAETTKLGDGVRTAEAARAAVWEDVKTANRAVEAAKTDINSLQDSIEGAKRDADKAKRAKLAAEAQLATVMRKAENARSPEALDKLAVAEDAAEARLLDLAAKQDTANEIGANLKSGMPKLNEALQTVEAARRSLDDNLRKVNQSLKDAQTAFTLSKREDARYLKPVSVLISRKDQRLYVRQGFEPVLEVPVSIDRPDQPIGTHVFTAMDLKGDNRTLGWSVISLRSGSTNAATLPARALDRIQIPAEALAAIEDVIKPGSTMIVSDESTSQYFGNGTDFTVAVR
jgi:L,D-transpeptidase catalytic domain